MCEQLDVRNIQRHLSIHLSIRSSSEESSSSSEDEKEKAAVSTYICVQSVGLTFLNKLLFLPIIFHSHSAWPASQCQYQNFLELS